MIMVLTALAGAVGAVCRFLVDKAITARFHKPGLGIALVNIIGSFGIGLVVGLGDSQIAHMLSVGLLGGFTTFSTAMVDICLRIQKSQVGSAIILAIGVFAACVASAACGMWLVS